MAATDLDVLVIGAGVHGVGVAQAMAAAGHSVMLLERSTVAAGTSGRSSKLIHGGLRYLETLQLSLVRESLRERKILLEIAPELVHLMPFVIPVYRTTSRAPWQIRAGLSLYAVLGNLTRDVRFRVVPRREWDSLEGLCTDGLRAVFRYHDGQTDDAELCRAVLASASELGVESKLGAEVLRAERSSVGWSVRFQSGEEEHERTARTVVNAAGPWVNRVIDRFHPPPPRREVELVAGAHIEFDGPSRRSIYYTEAPADRRAVFVMPWKGHTLVGTTEEPYQGDPAAVEPTEREIEYLESTFRHYFRDDRGQRTAAWAGLRVLPSGRGAAFSRPREVILVSDDRSRPSLVSIYGGKLTGYRHTAHKVARILARSLPAARRVADTRTLRLPRPD